MLLLSKIRLSNWQSIFLYLFDSGICYLHTSNPGYDSDDTSCPLKNNGILFHKAENLNLTCIIKNIYKAEN
jgi:hypothetical protein